MGYHKVGPLETPEAGNSPVLTGDLKKLAEGIVANYATLASVLTLTAQSGSYSAKSGDFVEATGSGSTITVPVTANALTFVACAATGELTVKAASGVIVGDFTNAASCKLLPNQHLLLIGDGTNARIIAGEPKREQTYSALVNRTAGTEYEPSATRETWVSLTFETTATEWKVIVGGVIIAQGTEAGANLYTAYGFPCLPGVKWKLENAQQVQSSYLFR